jgi:hypothetical protein
MITIRSGDQAHFTRCRHLNRPRIDCTAATCLTEIYTAATEAQLVDGAGEADNEGHRAAAIRVGR